MVVEHGLPCGGAVELEDPEPIRCEHAADRVRDLARAVDHRAQVLRIRAEDVVAVRLRDDQRVAVGDRKDVHEHERAFILADHVRGCLLAHDLAEDAVAGFGVHGRVSACAPV